jgi:hypothetical protein
MSQMTAIELHLAKNAFQAHGIDAEEKMIARGRCAEATC